MSLAGNTLTKIIIQTCHFKDVLDSKWPFKLTIGPREHIQVTIIYTRAIYNHAVRAPRVIRMFDFLSIS